MRITTSPTPTDHSLHNMDSLHLYAGRKYVPLKANQDNNEGFGGALSVIGLFMLLVAGCRIGLFKRMGDTQKYLKMKRIMITGGSLIGVGILILSIESSIAKKQSEDPYFPLS